MAQQHPSWLPVLTPGACPTSPPTPSAGIEEEDEEVEGVVLDEELEAEEELKELVKEADIDPAVAAQNARLVEQFKERMKVGLDWGGWPTAGPETVCGCLL